MCFFVQTNHTRKEPLFLMFKEINLRNHSSLHKLFYSLLFFETDAKQVILHTQDKAYLVKHKLYELENILGAGFMRISKSTIINLDQIYGLTRSISDCKIQFHDTYKTVYASRRYYKELRTRLDERRSL